jgi:2-polyprenyl-3-methyl-5-hydroxy-6-metoxy-1,4-benzoquinol methylase
MGLESLSSGMQIITKVVQPNSNQMNSENSVNSPLTGNSNTKEISQIATDKLIQEYQKDYNIDVSSYFKGISFVSVYESIDSGYRFYYPFNISGNDSFYQHFQEFDWYYMPWKWEHENALKGIQKSDKILEVGSGGNGFLEKMSNLGYNILGLELNSMSIRHGQEKGLKVLPETVQQHAENYKGTYDVVCSFQVLEHISDVHSFLEAQLTCLKPNGKLIISVPNNDSYISLFFNALNAPPHHMGLWTRKSLESLCRIFPIKLLQVDYEPLQPYHRFYALKKIYQFHWKLPKLFSQALAFLSPLATNRLFRKELVSHTIQVQFSKIA